MAASPRKPGAWSKSTAKVELDGNFKEPFRAFSSLWNFSVKGATGVGRFFRRLRSGEDNNGESGRELRAQEETGR